MGAQEESGPRVASNRRRSLLATSSAHAKRSAQTSIAAVFQGVHDVTQLEQPRVRLDKAAGVPLYLQIRDLLKADIADGTYGPGDMLPSEFYLMVHFGVSRTTVRLAVEALSVQGMVHKEQGRGTFIAAKPIFVTPSKLQSFTDELRDLGYSPGTKLLNVSTCACSIWVAQELELEPQSPVLKVTRLRTASRRPVGLCVSHLNTQQFQSSAISTFVPSHYTKP